MSLTKLNEVIIDITRNKHILKTKENNETELKETEFKVKSRVLLASAGLSKYETIKQNLTSPLQKQLLNKLLKWKPFLKEYRLPYVYGPSGVGKTFISKIFGVAAIERSIKRGYPITVRYEKSVEMFSRLDQFRFKGDSYELNKILWSDILILDDFPYHPVTSSTLTIMHQLLSYRVEFNKPTLVTSNIPITKVSKILQDSRNRTELDKSICDAIEDRVFELCSIFAMKGESIRLKQATERLEKGERES